MNPKNIHTDSARANERCEILAILYDELMDVFNEFPDFGDEFYELVEQKEKLMEKERRKAMMTKFTFVERNACKRKASLEAKSESVPPDMNRRSSLFHTSFHHKRASYDYKNEDSPALSENKLDKDLSNQVKDLKI